MGRLAFRGHATRGAEIISILQMYGGENYYDALCDNPNIIYFIGEKQRIESSSFRKIFVEDFHIFQLEDYLERYPIMVGDFVNFELDSGNHSDKVIDVVWDEIDSPEKGPYYITEDDMTKEKHCCCTSELTIYEPYEESPVNKEAPSMKLYRVTIRTYYFGIRLYELFVLADSEQEMKKVVHNKIRRDNDAEILVFEEIDLKDTTNRVI